MSDQKNVHEAQAPEASEHHEEHPEAHHEEHHKKHGDHRFHPEKYRREHAVIHPAQSGVPHLDSGAVILK